MKPAILLPMILVSSLSAQDWTTQKAMQELEQLVLTKMPMDQWPARNKKIAEWLARVEKTGLDLGAHSYAPAIARYFNRDYVGAGDLLLGYFTKHESLPNKKFDTIVGRIMLGRASAAIRGKDYAIAEKAIPHSLALYSSPATIYRALGGSLKRDGSDAAIKLLNDLLARALTDKRLSEADKQNVLTQIYAPKRPAGRGLPPQRATAAKPLKPFKATDIDGEPISLADYRGKVVLVDFWATWCGPCLRAMPHIVEAYDEFNARGFEIIGISLDSEPGQQRGGPVIAPKPNSKTTKKIRKVAKEHSMTWRQIYEGGGWSTRLARENGIRSIPATFLIDRTGKVRYTNLRGRALAEKISELLGRGR